MYDTSKYMTGNETCIVFRRTACSFVLSSHSCRPEQERATQPLLVRRAASLLPVGASYFPNSKSEETLPHASGSITVPPGARLTAGAPGGLPWSGRGAPQRASRGARRLVVQCTIGESEDHQQDEEARTRFLRPRPAAAVVLPAHGMLS